MLMHYELFAQGMPSLKGVHAHAHASCREDGWLADPGRAHHQESRAARLHHQEDVGRRWRQRRQARCTLYPATQKEKRCRRRQRPVVPSDTERKEMTWACF